MSKKKLATCEACGKRIKRHEKRITHRLSPRRDAPVMSVHEVCK